jgi:hypothetical protein
MNSKSPFVVAIALATCLAGGSTAAPLSSLASIPTVRPYRAAVHDPTPATAGRSLAQVEGETLARTRDGGWIRWRIAPSSGGIAIEALAYAPTDADARRAGWALPSVPGRAVAVPPATLSGCAFVSTERSGLLAVYGCRDGQTLLVSLKEEGAPRPLAYVEGSFQGAFLNRIAHVGAWSVTLAGIDAQGRFHFGQVQWDDRGGVR